MYFLLLYDEEISHAFPSQPFEIIEKLPILVDDESKLPGSVPIESGGLRTTRDQLDHFYSVRLSKFCTQCFFFTLSDCSMAACRKKSQNSGKSCKIFYQRGD
jgi:hypothetical protein